MSFVRAAALLAAVGLACAVASRVDVAELGGGIKGDEATYIGLAASIGIDRDFTFGPGDLERFQQWYRGGPQGIFLKRGKTGELYFGKALVHGLLSAPFALLAGLGGLLVFNFACVAAVLIAGYLWLRTGSRRVPALAFATAFVAGSIAPLYAFWLTSDELNFALVFLALACAVAPPGQPCRPLHFRIAGLVLLGAAIYSKPLNIVIAPALALAAGDRGLVSPLKHLSGIAAAVLLCFALNAAITGEMNYQGGDRKTFYGTYPYDSRGHTFDSTGIALATDTLQAPVGREGRLASLPVNAWYFLAGRHFGLLPFGWPWLVVVCWWAIFERRKALWQGVLLAAVAACGIATLIWMPYTWSGGGGPVGNRYFLSLAASLFFLAPRITSFTPAAVAAIGLLFVGPSLAQPFTTVKQPWLATRAAIFDVLPFELTNASDFPVILDRTRSRVPQGRAPTLFVALLDERSGMGGRGWIAVQAGETANLLVRSPLPLESVTIGVKSTSACTVDARSRGVAERVSLGNNDRRDFQLRPAQVFSRDSYVFILNVDARGCAAPIEVAMQAHAHTGTDRNAE